MTKPSIILLASEGVGLHEIDVSFAVGMRIKIDVSVTSARCFVGNEERKSMAGLLLLCASLSSVPVYCVAYLIPFKTHAAAEL